MVLGAWSLYQVLFFFKKKKKKKNKNILLLEIVQEHVNMRTHHLHSSRALEGLFKGIIGGAPKLSK
jgi:hypothetical protein